MRNHEAPTGPLKLLGTVTFWIGLALAFIVRAKPWIGIAIMLFGLLLSVSLWIMQARGRPH